MVNLFNLGMLELRCLGQQNTRVFWWKRLSRICGQEPASYLGREPLPDPSSLPLPACLSPRVSLHPHTVSSHHQPCLPPTLHVTRGDTPSHASLQASLTPFPLPGSPLPSLLPSSLLPLDRQPPIKGLPKPGCAFACLWAEVRPRLYPRFPYSLPVTVILRAAASTCAKWQE